MEPVAHKKYAWAKFVLGMPFVEDNALALISITPWELYKHYLELRNAKRNNRESSVLGYHNHEPFLSIRSIKDPHGDMSLLKFLSL